MLLPAYVLLSVLSGLAVAGKHTAAVTVAAVFFALGSVHLWGLSRSKWHHLRRLVYLSLAGVLSLLVFYTLNPAWWGDPVGALRAVLSERTTLLENQTAAFGGYTDFADQVGGFLRQVFIARPMYSEADFFLAYIPEQIAAYEASPWSGVALGGSVFGGLLLFALCAYGAARLLLNRGLPLAVRWLLGIWVVVTVGFTLLLTPLEWQRYYVPVFPIVGLLAAHGLTCAAYGLWSWRRNPPRNTRKSASSNAIARP